MTTAQPERGSLEGEVPAQLLDRVRAALLAQGYAALPGPRSEAAFEALAAGLGEVQTRYAFGISSREHQDRSNRTVRPERPGAYDPQGLPLHTDHIEHDLIALRCAVPDPDGGPTLLLDLADLPDALSKADQRTLCATPALRIDQRGAEEVCSHQPILRPRGGGYDVYYAPWLLLDEYPEEQQAALERFQAWIADKAARATVTLRLEAGECLFIDNRRMLHGRGPLPATSPRRLQRLSIRTRR